MARKAAVKKAGKKAPAKKAPAKKAKAAPAPKAVKVTATAGKTVTASALLQSVADHLGVKKSEAKAMVEGYTDVVKAYVMKGAKVKIGDIGMIMIRARKARSSPRILLRLVTMPRWATTPARKTCLIWCAAR